MLATDTSEDESVTFTYNSNSSVDVVICGALSIELEPAAHLVEVDKSEVPTTFTADELETIGFASATKRFALLLDVAYNLPASSNTYKLRANLIRYPYFGNDANSVYTRAISVYGNRNNTYYSATSVTTMSVNPWSGTAMKNTMYYADGAILYDLSSTYVLDAGAVAIVGCY